MMYGHVDNPRHWVAAPPRAPPGSRTQHWRRDAGFTEFVPLPFVHNSAPIYLAGVARPGPTLRDNLAVHAMARIMLHGRIDNIQTSWVKLGVDGTRAMLNAGANDVGGTLMEETISRMAGSEHGSAKTVEELVEIGAGIGRPVVQRTTTYGASRTEGLDLVQDSYKLVVWSAHLSSSASTPPPSRPRRCSSTPGTARSSTSDLQPTRPAPPSTRGPGWKPSTR